MKGSKKVIDCMNKLLAGELMARDQYFIHSRMAEDWGFTKIYERYNHEMQEETEHSHDFIHRILMLDGTPNVVPEKMNVGHDISTMFKNDLDLELKVRDNLKEAIKLCEEEMDFVSRDLIVKQLFDTEEDHAHWLEQQLELIDKMGLQNYLQSQM